MKRSSERVLTTHVGSLPRPDDLVKLYADNAPDDVLQPRLSSAVAEVVKRQRDSGIDIVGDGEYGKATRAAVDYGAWWSYIYERMEGFEARPGRVYGETFGPMKSQDRATFQEFYATGAPMSGGAMAPAAPTATAGSRLATLLCTGPVRYTGRDMIGRDIENFRAALGGDVSDAFMPAVSPATLQIIPNEHYGTQEDYTWALAEAIREEYRAIVDAGFILQIDDPALVDLYDWWYSADNDLAGFRKWAAFQVEAVNHALEGIPEDRVRFHICWGSWHGPHSTDVPLKDIADLLITVKAQAYSVEAGNVRHEHEWKVWRDQVKLPEGKIVIPGVVSHATNVLEHPELVAERIMRYAEIVGRENVIAGTDCGLGGRIHPQLVWAKLQSLVEGAAIASRELWA